MIVQFTPLRISKKISEPTLGLLINYVDAFAQGDFVIGFEADRMVVRFADPNDEQLLKQQFPSLVESAH